jgi:hypothetical protein
MPWAAFSASLGNGIAETRTYDARQRLSTITDGRAYTLSIPSTGGYAPNSDILSHFGAAALYGSDSEIWKVIDSGVYEASIFIVDPHTYVMHLLPELLNSGAGYWHRLHLKGCAPARSGENDFRDAGVRANELARIYGTRQTRVRR